MKKPSKPAGKPGRKRLVKIAAGILVFLVGLALAVSWLGRIKQPTYEGRPLLEWAGNLNSPNEAERLAAQKAVRAVGPEGIPALVQALERGDSFIGNAVEGWENQIPRPIWRFLYSTFRPYEPRQQRAAAARALGLLGPATENVIPALTKALADRRATVVTQASEALAAMGKAGATALGQALPGVQDANKMLILAALIRMGPAGREAAPAVADLLKAPTDTVLSDQAITTLKRIGAESIPVLIDSLTEREASVRGRIQNAIRDVVQDDLLSWWRLLAEFPKATPVVRLQLLEILKATSVPSRRVAVALAQVALNDPNPEVRSSATTWLCQTNITTDDLDRFLSTESQQVRERVRQLREAQNPAPAESR